MGWRQNLKDWSEGNTEKSRTRRAAKETEEKARAEKYSEYMKSDAYKARVDAYAEEEKREKEEREAKVARGEHIWSKRDGAIGACVIGLFVTGVPMALVVFGPIGRWLWITIYLVGFTVTSLIAYQCIRLVRWILDVRGVWKARGKGQVP